MAQNVSRDQSYTQRVLNYLQAGYQGKFAELNIYSQLGYSAFKAAAVEQVKKNILTVKKWLEALYSGRWSLSEDDSSRTEHQQISKALESAKQEMERLVLEQKRLLTTYNQDFSRDDVIKLIARYARYAYSTDNFLRGFIAWGKLLQDQNMIAGPHSGLENSTKNLQRVGEFVQIFRTQTPVPEAFIEQLKFLSRTLPGVFRSQVHDYLQLLWGPTRPFTFPAAGFIPAEAEKWQLAYLEPVEAGYWRAHEIPPEEVLTWKGVGINDPLIAAEWCSLGLTPGYAGLWREVGFPPLLALQWHKYNISPDVAVQLFDQGYETPESLPAELWQQLFPNEQGVPEEMAADNLKETEKAEEKLEE